MQMKEYFGLKINSTAVDEMVKFDLETLIAAKKAFDKASFNEWSKKEEHNEKVMQEVKWRLRARGFKVT